MPENLESDEKPGGHLTNKKPAPILQNVLEDPAFNQALVSSKKKSLVIDGQITGRGIRVLVSGNPFEINYPKKVWQKYPSPLKKVLADNVTFSQTFHLPLVLPQYGTLEYQMPNPITQALFFKGMAQDLPSTAFMNGMKTVDLLRKLFDIKYKFEIRRPRIANVAFPKPRRAATIPFTFGKDSLLTYGLCKELNIASQLIFVYEPTADSAVEGMHKMKLAKQFFQEFDVEVGFLQNQLGVMREAHGWIGWELQLTQYSLILLPYAYAHRSRYLFFSNEQSCNFEFYNDDGFLSNPVLEQSHSWMAENNMYTRILGAKNTFLSSLVGPIHELAIIKILHHRYKNLAKYQMSCWAENKQAKKKRWCGNCSKCARIYIFLLAMGVDPKRVDFQDNMLAEKNRGHFSVFEGVKRNEGGYDASKLGRDEQLLAFYLAYKRGVRGPLMDLFIKNYLTESSNRERELRKTFFSVYYPASTIPEELKPRVLSIFKRELKNLK